jgi:hypothetical protein
MATVDNIFFRGVRGKIGGVVFFGRNKKTFVRMAPSKPLNRKATPHQQRIAKKFSAATQYGKEVIKNPELKIIYAARDNKKRGVYQLAFRDAFKAPEVNGINAERYHGLPGDVICISAQDDFMVKSVLVTITDSLGNIIEQGEAVKTNGSIWLYEAKVPNPNLHRSVICATATDLPGNTTRLEITT